MRTRGKNTNSIQKASLLALVTLLQFFNLNCMSSNVKLAVSSFVSLVASCSIWHSCNGICPSDRSNTDTNILTVGFLCG